LFEIEKHAFVEQNGEIILIRQFANDDYVPHMPMQRGRAGVGLPIYGRTKGGSSSRGNSLKNCNVSFGCERHRRSGSAMAGQVK
jgi:hypothetical protein